MAVVPGIDISVYDVGSVLYYLYQGVSEGIYPPLIFLGIGAMTDFSTMLSNPKLVLLGAAAQVGIFVTLIGGLYLGFTPAEAGAIGIIGGADGPTAIFLSAKLAPHLLGAIAIAAYSYMALVPVIQPPVMMLLTTKQERLIRMKAPREVSKRERILFPVGTFIICGAIAPGAITLIGMLCFGNLLRESGVTERLANTARKRLIDIVTILLGFCVGASTQAQTFLTPQSMLIFGLGALAFAIATACGVLAAKGMNLFLTDKINPLVGAAGVSAVPDSARVVQHVGQMEDPEQLPSDARHGARTSLASSARPSRPVSCGACSSSEAVPAPNEPRPLQPSPAAPCSVVHAFLQHMQGLVQRLFRIVLRDVREVGPSRHDARLAGIVRLLVHRSLHVENVLHVNEHAVIVRPGLASLFEAANHLDAIVLPVAPRHRDGSDGLEEFIEALQVSVSLQRVGAVDVVDAHGGGRQMEPLPEKRRPVVS
jgi:carboxybiotin decarboxylase